MYVCISKGLEDQGYNNIHKLMQYVATVNSTGNLIVDLNRNNIGNPVDLGANFGQLPWEFR